MVADVVPMRLNPDTKKRFKSWRKKNHMTADKGLNHLLDHEMEEGVHA